MKILVTGANGYIGSKVVKTLCDKGVNVIATDFDDTHIDSRAYFVKADIFEEKDNWWKFFNCPDVCLHMAWRDGFIHNSDKHMLDLSAHYKFMTNLIDNGLPQIACMGSMHEVGYWEGAIDENTRCNPLSQYGIAKNALRKAIEIHSTQKGCKFQWLRGYYIFGDDSFGNSIFCKIRNAVKNGQTEFPFTTGKNKYDFIHIDRLAEQIANCVLQDRVLGIINTCSGVPVSLSDQIEWYIKYNNLPIKLAYGKYPERPYDSPCIYGDNAKIKEIENNLSGIKKVFVTGVGGQLGYDVMNELEKRGIPCVGSDIQDSSHFFKNYIKCDITDTQAVNEVINIVKPTAVIHCAAWTAVDAAEDEDKKELVKKINVDGTQNIANVCRKLGCKMMYISTDYVFNGEGIKPWKPDCKDYAPLNVYGSTKLSGELAVSSTLNNYFIVRIAWAFGNGNNFIKTMLSLADKGYKELRIVDDQIGTPTYTLDLARLLVDIIETQKYGYYHATNEGGYISWADFAKEIFKQAGRSVKVTPVTTAEYGISKAKRPFNSRLDKSKLSENGFTPLPDWKDALKRYLNSIDGNK